jgi:hypothetical protein
VHHLSRALNRLHRAPYFRSARCSQNRPNLRRLSLPRRTIPNALSFFKLESSALGCELVFLPYPRRGCACVAGVLDADDVGGGGCRGIGRLRRTGRVAELNRSPEPSLGSRVDATRTVERAYHGKAPPLPRRGLFKPDDDGLEFPDIHQARVEASRALAEMVKEAMPDGAHKEMAIEVRSENRKPLLKVQITFEVELPVHNRSQRQQPSALVRVLSSPPRASEARPSPPRASEARPPNIPLASLPHMPASRPACRRLATLDRARGLHIQERRRDKPRTARRRGRGSGAK